MFVVFNTYTKVPVQNDDGSNIVLVFEDERHAREHAVSLREAYAADYPDRNPMHFYWGIRLATGEEKMIALNTGNVQTKAHPTFKLTGQRDPR